MIEIRLAQTDEDFQAFGALVSEYEAALPPELRHAELDRELAQLSQLYGPPHAAYVAMVDDVAGGCIALTRFDDTTSVIKRLYVAPQFRKHGIARQLVSACIDAARSRGDARVVLDTHRAQLPAAYALYRSMGFVDCEPYGSVEYACPTFMELTL